MWWISPAWGSFYTRFPAEFISRCFYFLFIFESTKIKELFSEIIEFPFWIPFENFLNVFELRFLRRIMTHWLSRWHRFNSKTKIAWVKSHRPISVDRRTRKSINTASDSEISSERKWKNDFLFFRIFISDSDFSVLFYYWNSFNIPRYTYLIREYFKIVFRIFIPMAEILWFILIILAWGIIL